MIDVNIMIKLIWDNWKLLCQFYDKEGMPAADHGFIPDSEKIITKKQFAQMWELAEKKEEPTVFTEPGSHIFFWIFCHKENLLVLGPMHSVPLSFEQEKAFFHERKIRNKDFPFKELTLAESFPIISLVYFMVTGEDLVAEKKKGLECEWRQLDSELQKNRITNKSEQRFHMPYQFEQEWYQAISEGKIVFPADGTMSLDQVGKLAKGNVYKQIEYTVIAELTLITRAAMEGGVSPIKAYEMSDIFFQECSQCHETVELLEIGAQAVDSFTRAVREVKQQGVQNPGVERCKDYIARHLTEKITVSEIAEELKMSYSYLAAQFLKGTGTNIKKYILQEKLNAVANQLKYSEASVGEIADYFSFPSASSMCTFFKETYGMSPTEYRRTHKVVDFVSSKTI